ncbi:MAG: ribonuclease III [Oscillibacter sp.]|jgi:ribonuclease-3 family protein|nr:ribonuclease III [Oscillibacter sp.]
MNDYFHAELSANELQAISSIGLAHLGDAVFELLVRTYLCAHGKATGNGLHKATIALVCAESQAKRAERIAPMLTEEEQDVFRRGRNAQVHSVPSHASRAQYAQATALEALLGWLYLKNRQERINELFCEMMKDEG